MVCVHWGCPIRSTSTRSLKLRMHSLVSHAPSLPSAIHEKRSFSTPSSTILYTISNHSSGSGSRQRCQNQSKSFADGVVGEKLKFEGREEMIKEQKAVEYEDSEGIAYPADIYFRLLREGVIQAPQ